KLKMIIESHTGIAVSVGIGSTKTMAKLANHAAKKYPATNGICVLESLRWIRRLMQITDVGELWGVGRRYKLRLNAMGIHTVHQLAVCEPGKIRQHFGVVLERTCLELNGQSCLGIESIEPKKQIISSRSFSRRVTCLDELSESICSHVAKAASKLRKQNSVCHYLSVFSMSSPFNQSETYTAISGQYQFVTPTADTRVMILAARQVLQIIYKENVRYAKAGVMLLDLCPHDEVQLDLFANKSDSKDDQISDKSEVITTLMDELNKKYGQNSQQQAALFIASEGIKDKQTWQMSREMLSPCYTTNINQIPKVH
ncbi:DinB/UmuC family translesion DNA polymerase, partial [Psychrobacter sp. T6-1]|uniref:DinB/UmuC family translesion DNA polymerase n=1 Tax=Psychrobacter sp. T6-1 TaxID=3457447 RepID=UPI003FD1F7A4